MLDKILQYRSIATLSDGARVLFRPLTADDKEKLIEMFATASDDDVAHLRDDVRNAELVGGWADNLQYDKVFPLVAVINDQIVGEVTLHFYRGPHRHIGEIRIFLMRGFRRRGIGTLMIKKIVEIARKFGLQQVVAEILAEDVNIIKAFQSVGFALKFVREDYWMTPDGATHDVAVLVMRLVRPKDVF